MLKFIKLTFPKLKGFVACSMSSLRPISITCVFWHCWASASPKHCQANKWVEERTPDEMHAGLRGCGAQTAVHKEFTKLITIISLLHSTIVWILTVQILLLRHMHLQSSVCFLILPRCSKACVQLTQVLAAHWSHSHRRLLCK